MLHGFEEQQFRSHYHWNAVSLSDVSLVANQSACWLDVVNGDGWCSLLTAHCSLQSECNKLADFDVNMFKSRFIV